MTATHTDRVADWMYHGLWGVLARWFRVPKEPPSLPVRDGELVRSFRPSEGWLRMRKLSFWIVLAIIDGALLAMWLIILFNDRTAALWLALPWLIIMVVPDIIAYFAIHLRYDTTWYVMSERSVRIRRRIWTIEEKTFTFENVQNVEIRQGPMQRYFGVSNLIIQTAGGGVVAGPNGAAMGSPHQGVIEGVHNAQEIRDSIMAKVYAARGAGLGDSRDEDSDHAAHGFSPEHLAALREIRELAAALALRG
jgi:membrane protein YdbS with pleckstrin-like domain